MQGDRVAQKLAKQESSLNVGSVAIWVSFSSYCPVAGLRESESVRVPPSFLAEFSYVSSRWATILVSSLSPN